MFQHLFRSLNLVQQRGFHLTSPTFSSPLRKKKSSNPLITKKQFDRKVRRLENEIKRLDSVDPKLKPILELQVSPQVKKEVDIRKRKETDQVGHNLLNAYLKVWSIYKGIETQQELRLIEAAARSQEKALNVLKRDYPQLYSAAIELDPKLIPYTVNNVKKDNPPDSYNCPDGRETDITKEWRL